MISRDQNTARTKTVVPHRYGRVLNEKTSKSLPGYMVVLGDKLGNDGHLFIGWAPDGCVHDLITRVQFGSPHEIGVIAFFRATASATAHHQAILANYRCRPNDANWYLRRPIVEYHIEDLRDATNAEDAPKKARRAKRKSKGNKRPQRKSN